MPAGRTGQRLSGVRAGGAGPAAGQEPFDAGTLPARTGGQAGVRVGASAEPALPLAAAGVPPILAVRSVGRVSRASGPAESGRGRQRVAADWHRAGVSLATVQRAILLGSVRKSMSRIDRQDGEPVRSLRYFASLVEEVRTESYPESYWQHLELSLLRFERLGQARRTEASGGACPDLAQAGASGAAPGPSFATGADSREADRKETG